MRTTTRWGIRKVAQPETLIGFGHWTRKDAEDACKYNSQRWGAHEVVAWEQSEPRVVIEGEVYP